MKKPFGRWMARLSTFMTPMGMQTVRGKTPLDHMESFYGQFAFQPSEDLRAEVEINVLGNVPPTALIQSSTSHVVQQHCE